MNLKTLTQLMLKTKNMKLYFWKIKNKKYLIVLNILLLSLIALTLLDVLVTGYKRLPYLLLFIIPYVFFILKLRIFIYVFKPLLLISSIGIISYIAMCVFGISNGIQENDIAKMIGNSFAILIIIPLVFCIIYLFKNFKKAIEIKSDFISE
jgi:integral membrane sensor domain MASE1